MLLILVQLHGTMGTFSSMTDPKKRKWREWSVSVWILCQIHHQTGCCNWGTEQETHWTSYCGRQSLPEKTKTLHKELLIHVNTDTIEDHD